MPKTTKLAVTPEDIAKYDEIQKQIAKLTEQKEALRKLILGNFEPDKYIVGAGDHAYNVDITIVRGQINAKLFERDFPYAEFKELYKHVPDSGDVLEELGDDALKYFGTTQRLSIKLAN